MNTKISLLLAAVLAAGSAAAQTGDVQVNPRNPTDSPAFDVMETDQGPPTAADRQYAKPKHKKHGKKHRSADTQPYDGSTMNSTGASGNTGTTGSGMAPQWQQPSSQPSQQSQPQSGDLRSQPDRETTPDQPRVDR